jgi:hypothetical protein
MIEQQDIEHFYETIDDLDRAILDVTTFEMNAWDYYLNLIEKVSEFERAFKFKILPQTTNAYKTFGKHLSEFLHDIYSLANHSDMKQHKLFMRKLYYDMKTLSLELQSIKHALNAEKVTLDLLLKFPYWLVRHQQDGDFYNYAWVYDKVNEIESDAPRFFSLFQNEFNEMRNIAINSDLTDREKKQRMDDVVQLLINLGNDLIRSAID